MGKLKDCPCCGNDDIIHANFGHARHTVMCRTCELSTGYMLDDDEAEEAWNSRPREDALEDAYNIIKGTADFIKSDRDSFKIKVGEAKEILKRLVKYHKPLNVENEHCELCDIIFSLDKILKD